MQLHYTSNLISPDLFVGLSEPEGDQLGKTVVENVAIIKTDEFSAT